MSTYCEFAVGNDIHGPYHERIHGFPTDNESDLFERLLLEINQAGLSWDLMLKKREGFLTAYGGLDVDKVAVYVECYRLADRGGRVEVVRLLLRAAAEIDPRPALRFVYADSNVNNGSVIKTNSS